MSHTPKQPHLAFGPRSEEPVEDTFSALTLPHGRLLVEQIRRDLEAMAEASDHLLILDIVTQQPVTEREFYRRRIEVNRRAACRDLDALLEP
jgi:hypothetical protein